MGRKTIVAGAIFSKNAVTLLWRSRNRSKQFRRQMYTDVSPVIQRRCGPEWRPVAKTFGRTNGRALARMHAHTHLEVRDDLLEQSAQGIAIFADPATFHRGRRDRCAHDAADTKTERRTLTINAHRGKLKYNKIEKENEK